MTVVAMTREIGSLGAEVAAGVARELGLTVVHSEIVANQVASRLGVEEGASAWAECSHPLLSNK